MGDFKKKFEGSKNLRKKLIYIFLFLIIILAFLARWYHGLNYILTIIIYGSIVITIFGLILNFLYIRRAKLVINKQNFNSFIKSFGFEELNMSTDSANRKKKYFSFPHAPKRQHSDFEIGNYSRGLLNEIKIEFYLIGTNDGWYVGNQPISVIFKPWKICWEFQLKKEFPSLILTPHEFTKDLYAEAVNLKDFQFESNYFNKLFRISGDNEKFSFQVLDPVTMEKLSQFKQMSMEINEDKLILINPNSLSIERLKDILELGKRIVEKLPD